MSDLDYIAVTATIIIISHQDRRRRPRRCWIRPSRVRSKKKKKNYSMDEFLKYLLLD